MAVYVQNATALLTAYLAYIDDVTYGSATPGEKTAGLLALNAGYRRYLTGEYVNRSGDTVVHVWSFVEHAAQITLATSDDEYDLPDAYEGNIGEFTYDYNTKTVGEELKAVDYDELLAMRRDNSQGGLPKYYCVRAKDFAAATGSTYEWMCYPTPTATENALTASYRYRIALADLTDSATVYPAGLVGCGDLIVQATRAIQEWDTAGQDGSETARFYRMMHEMVVRDKKLIPDRKRQHTINL